MNKLLLATVASFSAKLLLQMPALATGQAWLHAESHLDVGVISANPPILELRTSSSDQDAAKSTVAVRLFRSIPIPRLDAAAIWSNTDRRRERVGRQRHTVAHDCFYRGRFFVEENLGKEEFTISASGCLSGVFEVTICKIEDSFCCSHEVEPGKRPSASPIECGGGGGRIEQVWDKGERQETILHLSLALDSASSLGASPLSVEMNLRTFAIHLQALERPNFALIVNRIYLLPWEVSSIKEVKKMWEIGEWADLAKWGKKSVRFKDGLVVEEDDDEDHIVVLRSGGSFSEMGDKGIDFTEQDDSGEFCKSPAFSLVTLPGPVELEESADFVRLAWKLARRLVSVQNISNCNLVKPFSRVCNRTERCGPGIGPCRSRMECQTGLVCRQEEYCPLTEMPERCCQFPRMLPYFVGDGPSFVRRKRETYYVEDDRDDEENADDILEESVKSESDINIDTQKEEEEEKEEAERPLRFRLYRMKNMAQTEVDFCFTIYKNKRRREGNKEGNEEEEEHEPESSSLNTCLYRGHLVGDERGGKEEEDPYQVTITSEGCDPRRRAEVTVAHKSFQFEMYSIRDGEWTGHMTEVGSQVDADEVYEEVEEWRPMDSLSRWSSRRPNRTKMCNKMKSHIPPKCWRDKKNRQGYSCDLKKIYLNAKVKVRYDNAFRSLFTFRKNYTVDIYEHVCALFAHLRAFYSTTRSFEGHLDFEVMDVKHLEGQFLPSQYGEFERTYNYTLKDDTAAHIVLSFDRNQGYNANLGAAPIGHVCNDDKKYAMIEAAVNKKHVEDGPLANVEASLAAHEFGHLLGLYHNNATKKGEAWVCNHPKSCVPCDLCRGIQPSGIMDASNERIDNIAQIPLKWNKCNMEDLAGRYVREYQRAGGHHCMTSERVFPKIVIINGGGMEHDDRQFGGRRNFFCLIVHILRLIDS